MLLTFQLNFLAENGHWQNLGCHQPETWHFPFSLQLCCKPSPTTLTSQNGMESIQKLARNIKYLCGSSAYIWADWCLHFERVLSCWLMRPTTTQLAIPNQVMKSTMVCNFCCQMVPIQPIIMKDQQCQHLGIFTLTIELALQKQALSQTRQIQWWNIWILPLHLFI